ncbi:MAG: antibiotic biosynthesis monooxygenase [Ktedonobacteraceae bacterium]|nr:antibiotic biosynthesis monooxygenase [Ktedonobacteraceae bacterium]
MFVVVTIHYPVLGCKNALFTYMKRVEQEMQDTPGLFSIEGFQDMHENRLVAISRWQSQEAFQDSLPKMFAIGGRDDEWFARPNEVFNLTS